MSGSPESVSLWRRNVSYGEMSHFCSILFVGLAYAHLQWRGYDVSSTHNCLQDMSSQLTQSRDDGLTNLILPFHHIQLGNNPSEKRLRDKKVQWC